MTLCLLIWPQLTLLCYCSHTSPPLSSLIKLIPFFPQGFLRAGASAWNALTSSSLLMSSFFIFSLNVTSLAVTMVCFDCKWQNPTETTLKNKGNLLAPTVSKSRNRADFQGGQGGPYVRGPFFSHLLYSFSFCLMVTKRLSLFETYILTPQSPGERSVFSGSSCLVSLIGLNCITCPCQNQSPWEGHKGRGEGLDWFKSSRTLSWIWGWDPR